MFVWIARSKALAVAVIPFQFTLSLLFLIIMIYVFKSCFTVQIAGLQVSTPRSHFAVGMLLVYLPPQSFTPDK